MSEMPWARRWEDQVDDTDCVSLWSSQPSVAIDTHKQNIASQNGESYQRRALGLWAQRGTSHNQGGEDFLGMVPQMASPLTCTIPEILLEGCQEPCLLAAPASQSPLLLDAVSAEPNASSATPQPHLAPHRTLQDSCRSLPSLASSAKRPTHNAFVKASLERATPPQVPQSIRGPPATRATW